MKGKDEFKVKSRKYMELWVRIFPNLLYNAGTLTRIILHKKSKYSANPKLNYRKLLNFRIHKSRYQGFIEKSDSAGI
jgi:hypothetical protein